MKKSFATNVVLSLTTGALVSGFGDMQELAEFVLGRGIWSHELADKNLVAAMRELIYTQHPRLRDAAVFEYAEDLTRDENAVLVEVYVRKQLDLFGNELEIESGNIPRTESPVSSFQRIVKN